MTTPADLAAALIKDVPRYACTNAGHMEYTPFGTWVYRSEVLAALTAALDGVDERAGALTKRLRKTEEAGHVHHLSKADRLAAADLIADLLAQNAWLKANVEAGDLVNGLEKNRAEAAEAEVEKLRGALVEHNDLLRSTFQIAEREGVKRMIASTNWDAFYNRVAVVLKRHHQTANEARAALTTEEPK